MPKRPYCARTVFDAPTYSQGIKVTGGKAVLYISGQVSRDAKGRALHPGDFTAQARHVFQQLKAMVEAGGGTLRDVVKITTYLTDIRYRQDLAPIREEFFGKNLPTSTLVEVSALAHPDFLIEVEAVAILE